MRTKLFACFLLIALSLASPPSQQQKKWRPVVLMHGLLASAEAMSHAQKWIEADFPGIHTHNIEVGNGRQDSMFMEINKQVDLVAKSIQSDPLLKDGFNLIGHSQGGLLTRAYIERYNNPPVYNYISWAGPNDDVYGAPDVNYYCPDPWCPELADLMDLIMDGAWSDEWMQQNVAFSTYWKDPFNIPLYLEKNQFLADINNERNQKNATYKAHFSSLNRALLVYSTIDGIVVPKESPWFSFWAEGSETKLVPFNETKSFKEDYIGMKTLYDSGRLELQHIKCGHQNIPRTVCKEYYDLYTKPLLNNTLP